jgi:lysophospholipase L1-like esterase
VIGVTPAEIRSFVALGDSFTEGLQDDVAHDGRHRGWADRVAAALAVAGGGVRYANLAVRGRLLEGVVREQLPVVEALEPDLVSFAAGGNDLLRPRADVRAVLDRYERTVERLRDTGAEVVLFTAVTRAGGWGHPAVAARFGAYNRRVRRTADTHGCALVDLEVVAALRDRRLWHEDRLHLAPEGHRRVAAAVLEALGTTDEALLGGPQGWWRATLPARPAGGWSQRGTDLVADVRWVRRHFLPWVSRRLRGVSSGDGVLPKHVQLVDVLPQLPRPAE